jgi:K+-sensing histidine kinase KdpD
MIGRTVFLVMKPDQLPSMEKTMQLSQSFGPGLGIARKAVRVHRSDITALNVSPGAHLRIALPLDTNLGR